MKDENSLTDDPEPQDFNESTMIVNDANNMAQAASIRLLIPSKTAGIIIGKGGENIKNLRKEFNVKISIPDSTSFERILQLEGDMKTMLEVLEKILHKTISESTNPLDVRLLVHSSQAGCVIGRSGAKIRELRESSGLRTLKVYQMLCPNSTDRVIQLVGDLEKIIECISSINELLAESPIRGNRYSFDTRNSNETLALEYGGWATAASVGANGRPFTGTGYGPFVNGANRGGMFNDAMGRMGNPPGGDATTAAMMAAGMMRGAAPRMSVAMTSTTQVSVSDKMIGAIMGRAGSRINQVRQESGADIKISNQEPGCEDRIITITGTPDQIQNAQFLLQVCVRKYGEAHM